MPACCSGTEFQPLPGNGPADSAGVVPVGQLTLEVGSVCVILGLEIEQLLLDRSDIAIGLFQRLQLRLGSGQFAVGLSQGRV